MGNSKSKGKGQKDETIGGSDKQQLLDQAKKDFQSGNNFFRERKFDQAKQSYSAALDKLTKCDSSFKGHQSAVLSNLGVLEFGEGRFKEAKELLQKAIEERKQANAEQAAPPEREQKGDGDNLTSISLAIKRDMSFRQLHDAERLLAGEIKEHATIDAMTSDLLNNLAACCEVIGDLEEAQKIYEESLLLRKIVYGERSIKVAESFQNIATVLDFQGHQKEAEQLLEKALDIEVELFGPDSAESSVTLNNLAVLCEHLGKLEQAQSLLERCVAIRGVAYGPDHHYTQSVKQNLEYILNKRRSMEGGGKGTGGEQKEAAQLSGGGKEEKRAAGAADGNGKGEGGLEVMTNK